PAVGGWAVFFCLRGEPGGRGGCMPALARGARLNEDPGPAWDRLTRPPGVPLTWLTAATTESRPSLARRYRRCTVGRPLRAPRRVAKTRAAAGAWRRGARRPGCTRRRTRTSAGVGWASGQ